MRQLLAITLLLSTAAFGQVALIDTQKGHVAYGTTTLTMPALNTTSATSIVCATSTYEGFPYVKDSCGNTWSHAAFQNITTGFYFVENPVSCASDTITVSATYGSSTPAAICMSFSGTTTTYPVSAQTPYECWPETSPFQCGAITPATGDLILSMAGGVLAQTIAPTIDAGFSSPAYNSGANQLNVAMSYLVAGSTSPVNPTWTMGGTTTSTSWAGETIRIGVAGTSPPSGSGPNIYSFLGNGNTGTSGIGGNPKSATVYWPGPCVVISNGDLVCEIVENNIIVLVNNQSMAETEYNVTCQPNTVCIIAGTNSITTNGCTGSGGQGVSALLGHPYGLAADANDNLYISNQQCAYIQELVKSTGVLTLVAGGGSGGALPGGCGAFPNAGFSGDGGAATSALINCPQGVAVDPNNNPPHYFVLADSGNQRMRVVDLTGSTHTYFGQSTCGNCIETIVGTGLRSCDSSRTNVPGLSYYTVVPISGAIDTNGKLYFTQPNCDIGNVVDTSGNVSVDVGQVSTRGFAGDGGACASSTLNIPYDVSLDPVTNDRYYADAFNNVIRVCSASTGNITSVSGNFPVYGTGQGGGGSCCKGGYASLGAYFYPIHAAVVSSTKYYVTELRNNTVDLIETAPAINYTLTAACSGSGNGTVTSSDSAIDCTCTAGSSSGSCTDTVGSGTIITITASPSLGNNFGGFSGGSCSTSPCSVTMSGNTMVTATFGIVVPTVNMNGTIPMSGTLVIN